MPVSTPMKIMTLRISEDEKRRLELLAKEQNITLSFALREGAKMLLDEHRPQPRSGRQIAT